MARKRVVITGLGAITPIGHSAETFWNSLLAGKAGGGEISCFDTSRHKVRIACEVTGYNPEDHFDRKEARRLERFVQFALVAAREALAQSGLDLNKENRERIGTFIGAGVGGLQIMEEQEEVLLTKGPDRVSALLIPKMIANMGTGQVAMTLGLKGPNSCVVTACASSTHSIGDAFRCVAYGDADIILAGGTESCITPLGIAGFQNMKALSERNDDPAGASRPFSADRDGFVMGEGSGILVLEELEHARARGVKILAEIVGYGNTCDAHHITAPAPEGEGAQRSMRAAVRDAGLQLTDVQCINAHGTSTPLNDQLETIAVKKLFGEHAYQIPMSSIKGSIGHLLGAAGGVEAVASVKTLVEGKIPPTINYSERDEELNLDYVTDGARDGAPRTVLSNSFGFGGHNGSLLFQKWED